MQSTPADVVMKYVCNHSKLILYYPNTINEGKWEISTT